MNSDYEEYAIHDYDLPFDIDEYASIEEINHLCSLAETLEGTPYELEFRAIQNCFFYSFEEMVQNIQDVKYYPGCSNMEDVARYIVLVEEEYGKVPIEFRDYLNFKAFGDDLEAGSGNFLITTHGVFEYKG